MSDAENEEQFEGDEGEGDEAPEGEEASEEMAESSEEVSEKQDKFPVFDRTVFPPDFTFIIVKPNGASDQKCAKFEPACMQIM